MTQILSLEHTSMHETMTRFERQRVDELTNASERLAAPMQNTFSYELREDGHLWFQNESIGDLLHEGVATARRIVEYQPQFLVELTRRVIELDEYEAQRKLAISDGPDTLVVISPPPDVLEQGVDLGAYDSKRKKTLVRIHQRIESGVRSTSLSLDLSDRDGLESIADLFGGSIDSDATSEDILGMRLYASSSEHLGNISQVVRRTYDDVLTEKYGGHWYAGRQDDEVLDTLAFIEQQHDLIDQHMKVIKTIVARGGHQKLLEDARYDFAAALTRRMQGNYEAIDVGRAGVEARKNGEVYVNDCPEGLSPQQMLEQMGMGGNKIKCVRCPFCEQIVDAQLSGGYITCLTCYSWAGPNGKSYNSQSRHAKKTPATPQPAHKPSKSDIIHATYGVYAATKKEITVGGADIIVYDTRSGEELDRI